MINNKSIHRSPRCTTADDEETKEMAIECASGGGGKFMISVGMTIW